MRPFPSMWNCRVIHPYGLDPFSGDVRSLQGFSRSLEILTYMRSEAARVGMHVERLAVSKENEICVVIFPWDKQELPTPQELVNGFFHFHPKISEYYTSHPEDKGQLKKCKLDFHIPQHNMDYSDSDEEADEDHECEAKPCLNRVFAMNDNKQDKLRDLRAFYEWLQSIMYPSVTVYLDDDKITPDAVFMLTQLAPGWVGGALTC
ncbi:Hypothetical predicted protein [Paramuricea clavata]|uniref:Uncharacterized protein n=1 Tax=Paramuricea clavata TaxID=317549 RepID=A0A6S7HPN3_PARCT|nr:Hypothetical predicted protein [Paramuricea clavata]